MSLTPLIEEPTWTPPDEVVKEPGEQTESETSGGVNDGDASRNESEEFQVYQPNYSKYNVASTIMNGFTFEPSSGVNYVDPDGVPSFDPEHPNFHIYFAVNSCSRSNPNCTIDRIADALLSFPAPGYSGSNPIQDEQVGYAQPVFGYVRHEVYEYEHTNLIMNITMGPQSYMPISGGHIFHPGKVVRWVTQDKNHVYVRTYGDGTGPFGSLNASRVGVSMVWGTLDNSLFKSVGAR